jgi:peptide methionine sulfoxide reductase msrA/msrB
MGNRGGANAHGLIRQQLKGGLLFSIMRNLVRGLSVAAVLIAALAIGSPNRKLAAGASTAKPPAHCETATLASGCFWGLQESLRHLPGVIKTTVGYTGGTTPNPTYEMVCTGKTGHAEAVQVIFDPTKLSYEELLDQFFQSHDPTQPRDQAGGVKVQYRSAIFYHSEEQRRIAERVKKKISQSGKWTDPVVTEISPATKFYPAEAYHQDYLQKISGTHTCHAWWN